VLYLGLWLTNDYIALMMSLIIATIFFSILIISLIVEKIEPSRVPKWYFQIMLVSIFVPIVIGALYIGIMGGDVLSIFEVDF